MTTPIHPLTDQRKRRPDGRVIEDGEALGFDVMFRDAAAKAKATGSTFFTDAAPGSIDAAVKAAIEQAAKAEQMAPSEWLAKQDPRAMERFVESAAKAYVAEMSAAGIAKGFALDSAIRAEVDRAESLHHRQFAYLGGKAPKFNRDAAAVAACDRLANVAHAAERSKALSAARYQDGASLGNAVTEARNQRSYALRNTYSASRYSGG